jgi:apyrase
MRPCCGDPRPSPVNFSNSTKLYLCRLLPFPRFLSGRYRGVLTLISIPVLLMVVVMVGMPGSKLAGTNGSAEKFAVVIDAGSTGSRVHIFRFSTSGGRLELETDTFEQLKPGLSAYAENPSQSARSLKPLLDKAVATVPSNLQSSTSVEVRATAGLRLLPDGQADGILQAVRTYLKKEYPFKCSDESVSILDGKGIGVCGVQAPDAFIERACNTLLHVMSWLVPSVARA